jgi:acyl carrier protein
VKISDKEKDHILSDILNLVSANSNIPTDKISINQSLIDDLGLDSFSMVEIVYELELKYGVQVKNEDLKNVKTVSDIVSLVNDRL